MGHCPCVGFTAPLPSLWLGPGLLSTGSSSPLARRVGRMRRGPFPRPRSSAVPFSLRAAMRIPHPVRGVLLSGWQDILPVFHGYRFRTCHIARAAMRARAARGGSRAGRARGPHTEPVGAESRTQGFQICARISRSGDLDVAFPIRNLGRQVHGVGTSVSRVQYPLHTRGIAADCPEWTVWSRSSSEHE